MAPREKGKGFSCNQCHRKKIRCDVGTLEVPCNPCIRSGLQSSCQRENVPEAVRRLVERVHELEARVGVPEAPLLASTPGSSGPGEATTLRLGNASTAEQILNNGSLRQPTMTQHASALSTTSVQSILSAPNLTAPRAALIAQLSPDSTRFSPAPASTGTEPVTAPRIARSPGSTRFSAPPTNPVGDSSGSGDGIGVEDAAQILEFLAWGRRKDQVFHDAPENDTGPRKPSFGAEQSTSVIADAFSASVRGPHIDLLEMLLPSASHIKQLVEFHGRCLVWYHGSYNTATFRKELEGFFTRYGGSLRHPEVNFQWVGLLFAILTGSITCSTQHTALLWGFRDAERAKLSKQWYQATVTCLNLSDYLETHTIYSVQAISTLTISAHMIGYSNSQSVLLSSANRIAQSLGLHRLEVETSPSDLLSAEDTIRRTKRETGRRVWCQLCTQDWFSIPFSESYALNPLYFNTGKPLNCNDDGTHQIPLSTPTMTSYCNYLYDIASLIPQVQDAMTHSNTLYTKYEQVLSYDEKMRQLATASMPTFLSSASPVPETWPVFVPWARRSLAICAAHKIIMIHRKFLGPSFTNSAFAFTRRTCIAAAKTILKEVKAATDRNGPVLWIDQAFSVAAGIILCLDAFHRGRDESEYAEHRRLAEEAVAFLGQFPLSMIASRGIRLLRFLVDELPEPGDGIEAGVGAAGPRKRPGEQVSGGRPEKRAKTFALATFIRSMSGTSPSAIMVEEPQAASEMAWDAFADLFPPQTGFGDENLFSGFFEFEI